MKPVNLVNPDQITTELRSKINMVKNRILFLSPSVSSGEEREGKREDFESMGNQNIGAGGFGKVYKVRHKISQNIYAIKVIGKAKILEHDLVEQTKLEIRIMYTLNHEHIVKLYNHFEDEDNFYLILHYCSKGELYQKLKAMGTIDERSTAQYIREVISAVEYLHSLNPPIIHRDIKPENVLLDSDDRCKLGDFGWSNFFNPERKRMTYCGTPAYLSPEMIKQSGHDKSLDLWNMGVLLFELLTGRPPFEGPLQKDLFYNIEHVKINWPKDFSKLAKDLVCKLLKADPKQRINITEMKNHPWLKSIPLIKPIYENPEPIINISPNTITSSEYQVLSKKSMDTQKSEEEVKKATIKTSKDIETFAKPIDLKDTVISELNIKVKTLSNDLQKERMSNESHKKEIDKIKKDLEDSAVIISKNNVSNMEQKRLLEEINKLKILNKDREKTLKELEEKNEEIIEYDATISLNNNKIEQLEECKGKLQNKCEELKHVADEYEQKYNELKKSSEDYRKDKEKKTLILEAKIEEIQYKLLEQQAEKAENTSGDGVYNHLIEGVHEILSQIQSKVANLIEGSKESDALRQDYINVLAQFNNLKVKSQNELHELSIKHSEGITAAKAKANEEFQKRQMQYCSDIEMLRNKLTESEKKVLEISISECRYDNALKALEQKQKALDDSILLIRMISQEKGSLKLKQRDLLNKISDLEYKLALKKDEDFKKKLAEND